MAIDFSTGIGPTILRHLEDAQVVWLTTVGTSGTPQPNVVWFHWDGESVIVFSQPSAKRLRNIDHNGRVALNFNTDADGSFMYVMTGDAMIDHSGPRADQVPGYVAKYGAGIDSLGMTPATFAADYSVLIRIVPDHLRGF
jgi:PPOX class probable F420-dependent enzyme